MEAPKELKPEWRIFAEQYVIDWNGTRSYQVAFPKATYDTARSEQSTLLAKPCISDYIEHIQQDMAKLSGLSMLSNLNELKDILTAEGEQTKDKIKAIEVINKMLSFNSPEKTDIKIIDPLSPEERNAEIDRLLKKRGGKND